MEDEFESLHGSIPNEGGKRNNLIGEKKMILNNMIHFISKANKVKITISGQLIQYHFNGAFDG